jgi:response regulator RpfG family c-di-GMP phosphodiesterase
LPHDVAVTEIKRCTGSQFDPDVVGEFLEVIDTHRAAARDSGSPIPE